MYREKATFMMGKKERHFAPLINVSFEDLVPLNHFYRHLEKSLDLSFVREICSRECPLLGSAESKCFQVMHAEI